MHTELKMNKVENNIRNCQNESDESDNFVNPLRLSPCISCTEFHKYETFFTTEERQRKSKQETNTKQTAKRDASCWFITWVLLQH
jgi:hypothetical protein